MSKAHMNTESEAAWAGPAVFPSVGLSCQTSVF